MAFPDDSLVKNCEQLNFTYQCEVSPEGRWRSPGSWLPRVGDQARNDAPASAEVGLGCIVASLTAVLVVPFARVFQVP